MEGQCSLLIRKREYCEHQGKPLLPLFLAYQRCWILFSDHGDVGDDGVPEPRGVCAGWGRMTCDPGDSWGVPAFFQRFIENRRLPRFRPLGHPTFSTGPPRLFHWATQGFDWATQGFDWATQGLRPCCPCAPRISSRSQPRRQGDVPSFTTVTAQGLNADC